MRFLGVLPSTSTNIFCAFVHRVYSKLLFLYLVVFVLAQYTELFQILDEDLFEIVSNLAITLLYTSSIFKMLTCGSKPIENLTRQILSTEQQISKQSDCQIKRIYQFHVRWNYIADKLLLWIGLFTALPYFVNPIMEQVGEIKTVNSTLGDIKPLPFSSWFPFDRYKYYYWCYAYHTVAGVVGTCATVFTDIFFVGLMTFAIGQMKILQYRLENSKSIILQELDEDIPLESSMKELIGACVMEHQVIIK